MSDESWEDVLSERSWEGGVNVKNTFIEVVVHRNRVHLPRHTSEPAQLLSRGAGSHFAAGQRFDWPPPDTVSELSTTSSGGQRTPPQPEEEESQNDFRSEARLYSKMSSLRGEKVEEDEEDEEDEDEEDEDDGDASDAGEEKEEEAPKTEPEATGGAEEKEAAPKDGTQWKGAATGVTTLMMRNLPNKYTRQVLLDELAANGFLTGRDFNFFYLPIDHKNDANLGYCFINCVSVATAELFGRVFQGKKLEQYKNSSKTISITPASIQGYEANRAFLSTACVTHTKEEQYRPIFYQGGAAGPNTEEPTERPESPTKGSKQRNKPAKTANGGRRSRRGARFEEEHAGGDAAPPVDQANLLHSDVASIGSKFMGFSTCPQLGASPLSGTSSTALSRILAPFLPTTPLPGAGKAPAMQSQALVRPQVCSPTASVSAVEGSMTGVLSTGPSLLPGRNGGPQIVATSGPQAVPLPSQGGPGWPQAKQQPSPKGPTAREKPGGGTHQVRKLFVGGIPQDMNQDDLYKIFNEFARVKKAWLQRYRTNGCPGDAPSARLTHNHRGFGFVIFLEGTAVEQMLCNETSRFIEIRDGRKLEVKLAVSSSNLRSTSPNTPGASPEQAQLSQAPLQSNWPWGTA